MAAKIVAPNPFHNHTQNQSEQTPHAGNLSACAPNRPQVGAELRTLAMENHKQPLENIEEKVHPSRTKRRAPVAVVRIKDRWILRLRVQVWKNGVERTVQKASAFAKAEGRETTPPKSIMKLAIEEAKRIKGNKPEKPLTQMRIGDFFEEVYWPHVLKTKRPSTANGYAGLWSRYVAGTDFPRLLLREIRTVDVQNLLDSIANPRQVDAKQAARRHGAGPRVPVVNAITFGHLKHLLSGIFRFAAARGCLDFDAKTGHSPVHGAYVPFGVPEAGETWAYSELEVETMLRLLSDPAQTVVAVAAYGGLRTGEIRGLRWEDFEPATPTDDPEAEAPLGLLQIRRSVWRGYTGLPKSKASRAPVDVLPELAQYLESWRRACGSPTSGLIFANQSGKPASLDSLYWRKMRVVLQLAGVQWRGWHAFRRGLATALNGTGATDSQTQRVLRHADVSTTLKCYVKPRASQTSGAMRRVSEAFSDARSSDCSLKADSEAPERVQ
jgi:integrase